MSSEKQNKTPDWKQSFLQWEQAGGHVEPKEDLLWEKLQEKLQPRRNKPFTMLWVRRARAAAAVLILLAVSLFFFLRKNETVEKPAVVSKEPAQVPAPLVATPSVVVKEKMATDPINKQEMVPASIKREIKSVQLQDQNRKDAAIDPVPQNIAAVPEPIQPVVEKKSDSTPIATVIQPKRKLRIVHLNELNAPPPPTYAALKEEWRLQVEPEQENIISAPSIWPGKNKPKPSGISLGN